MTALRSLVVTGVGAVTAAGAGVDALWHATMAARPLAEPVTRYATADLTTRRAALVPDELWSTFADRWPGQDRAVQLALAAVDEATRTADLHGTVGLFVGTSLGAVSTWERWHEALVRHGDSASPPASTGHDDTAPALATVLSIDGPVVTVSTACTSSTAALIQAADALRLGEIDTAIVVGVDVLGRFVHAGFCRLGVLTPDDQPPSPFGKDRQGMWLGEGAAALVLQRDGVPKMRYMGGGVSADGIHMTAPDRTGAGLRRSMRRAMDEAGAGVSDIGWISAHATSTRFNDMMEERCFRGLYPDGSAPPVHAAKPVLGHCLGASGLIEVVLAAGVYAHGIRPPSFQPGPMDPDLPSVTLDRVAQPFGGGMIASVNVAIAGHNTAVVLGAP